MGTVGSKGRGAEQWKVAWVKRFKPFPNSNCSKQIQMVPNFDRSEKCLSMLRKISIKYSFEDLEEMNNFFHRSFLRLGVYLELKFREISRLEFDRIYYSFFLKL
jgi:hypothetical protein